MPHGQLTTRTVTSNSIARVGLCREMLSKDVQFFNAPLLRRDSSEVVGGYQILKTLRCIKCLDLANSVVSRSAEDQDLVAVYEYAIRPKLIPDDIHIFRPEEWEYQVMISDELVDKMRGRVSGIALLKTNR
jgi:hypothetical protein